MGGEKLVSGFFDAEALLILVFCWERFGCYNFAPACASEKDSIVQLLHQVEDSAMNFNYVDLRIVVAHGKLHQHGPFRVRAQIELFFK
jgi:hypothetical protein